MGSRVTPNTKARDTIFGKEFSTSLIYSRGCFRNEGSSSGIIVAWTSVLLNASSPSYHERALLLEYIKTERDAVQALIQSVRNGDDQKVKLHNLLQDEAKKIISDLDELHKKLEHKDVEEFLVLQSDIY